MIRFSTFATHLHCINAFTSKMLDPIAMFFLRIVGAKVFWDSGVTKWDGFLEFNTAKYDLFLYEYFCPDPVRSGALLLCDPEVLDYAEGSGMVRLIEMLALTAGVLEIVLPILLVIGLFTRFSALALLGMTLFIQVAVFPSWSHWWNPAIWWSVVLFTILARGPGVLSLDRLLKFEK